MRKIIIILAFAPVLVFGQQEFDGDVRINNGGFIVDTCFEVDTNYNPYGLGGYAYTAPHLLSKGGLFLSKEALIYPSFSNGLYFTSPYKSIDYSYLQLRSKLLSDTRYYNSINFDYSELDIDLYGFSTATINSQLLINQTGFQFNISESGLGSGRIKATTSKITLSSQGLEALEVESDTVYAHYLAIGTGEPVGGDEDIYNVDLDSVIVGGHFIRFNEVDGVHEFETAIDGVVIQGGQEIIVPVFNDLAVTLTNGTPVSYKGSNGDTIATVDFFQVSNDSSAKRAAGLVTADILPGEWGYITTKGYVRNIDLSTLTGNPARVIYGGDSILIDTIVGVNNRKVVFGVLIKSGIDGIIYVNIDHSFGRQITTKSYHLDRDVAGTYYTGGFYDAATTSTQLTVASPTVTYGTAGVAYSAHAFIVTGADIPPDAGVLGVRITGTKIDDAGVLTASFADTLVLDITSTSVNDYFEAVKFVGTFTVELITISGSPTTGGIFVNRGYAKYEDLGNTDYYVTGIEVVGEGDANDTGFGIELMRHSQTGWTYAATGFVPGDGVLESSFVDLLGYDNLANGLPWCWKRTGLDYFVSGSTNEGVVFRSTITTNNSVKGMDMHLTVEIDK